MKKCVDFACDNDKIDACNMMSDFVDRMKIKLIQALEYFPYF